MDDYSIHGKIDEEALKSLDKVLQRCKDHRLSLKYKKCSLMMTEGIVLGHHISKEGIKVDPNKVEVIQKIEVTKTQTYFTSFLNHAGYYRRFIEGFSRIGEPFFTLLKKDSKFSWIDDCHKSFETIINALTVSPIIKGPTWGEPFHIHTDASNFSIGAVLRQKDENGAMHAIYNINRNLSLAERNYTMSEKELLVVVYAINKFRRYIIGYKIFIHTDHVAIRYLMNKAIVAGRIIRWLLILQEFDITIVNKPGKDNVVSDFLS